MEKTVNKALQRGLKPFSCDFSLKYRKIQTLKKLLNINEELFISTEENLSDILIDFSSRNIMKLAGICFFLSNFPKDLKTSILKSIKRKNYSNDILSFQNLYKNNKEFSDFSLYVNVHILQEALLNFSPDDLLNEELTKEKYTEHINDYTVLLYSLLSNDIKENENFDFGDFILNLPLLLLWIEENRNKKIAPLKKDEYKILSAIIFGFDEDEILSCIQDIQTMDEFKAKTKEIADKFYVENIIQAIFRITLLKPYIWAYLTYDEIYFEIQKIRSLIKA